ncbi:MAG: sigma-54 dependent transcriptional regulator [Thermodesulforhabdaceae bacterium]
MDKIRVLLVDDEPSIRKLAEKELSGENKIITTSGSADEAVKLMSQRNFDVVILDMRLPDGDGLDLLLKIKEDSPNTEVIILTGHGTIDSAVKAMKMGAYDYVTKPFSLEYLELLIERAYERVCLKKDHKIFTHSIGAQIVPRLVGTSPKIREITKMIEKVAPRKTPVLITGESGSGKDVVAHMIHALSDRSDKPMIVKNCGGLQKELLKSELFGHVKGAFTGAYDAREGLISVADGGTLFLDEVGELPFDVQGSLLRFLETQRYRRLGDTRERQADVRLIFATHRNLEKKVEEGSFSEALYHRINVFRIHVPPLRERASDIPLLTEHFLGKLSDNAGIKYKISEEAMQCLMSYDWPGNVRELRNVIERASILAEGNLITPKVLPKEIQERSALLSTFVEGLKLKDLEIGFILTVVQKYNGNKSKAAKELGITRKTLYRKLKAYKQGSTNS